MNKEYPPLKAALGGIAIIDLALLWYFDWAVWAWTVAAVLLAFILIGWFQEALKIHRGDQESSPASASHSSGFSDSTSDDDDFVDSGRVLWQGDRHIRFAYQSYESGNSDREVTVHKVVSNGRGNGSTYFKGLCHLRGEIRTFRLDRIKGKVTDTATGEMATFRQLFQLASR